MDILRSLRLVFPHAQAWKPGYQALLTAVRSGRGHRPECAEKERQNAPHDTGCA